MPSRHIPVLAVGALVAAVGLAPALASPAAKRKPVHVTRVQSTVTIVNGSGATVRGWTLTLKVGRTVRIASTSGARAKLKKGVVTLTPAKVKSLTAGHKVTITVVVTGAKAPSGWKLGATSCKARSATRRGHTARQTVACTLPRPAPKKQGAPGETPAGPGSAPAPGTADTPPTWFAFSPYADMTLGTPPDLAAIRAAAGVTHFTLAFVLATANPGCTPAWGGQPGDPAGGTTPFDKSAIDAFRAAGGDVVISFGGQGGTELAVACTDQTMLTNAYQSVIDAYGITHIDFDVEGDATVADTAANHRRDLAIVALQHAAAAAGHPLHVSFTLAILPDRMEDGPAAVLKAAIDDGVDVSVVNGMAMDYGDSNAPPGTGMGEYATRAGATLAAKLTTLYPTLSAAQVWRKVGITPMLGLNDTETETFGLADRATLVDWAGRQHIGMLGMWSIGRDRQCPAAHPTTPAQADCSSITQPDWAFASALNQFAG